jgi:hypothetical protein
MWAARVLCKQRGGGGGGGPEPPGHRPAPPPHQTHSGTRPCAALFCGGDVSALVWVRFAG